MEKYKSLRNAVIALLIFGLLAFVCYGAIFTVLAVFETTSGSKFLYNHLLEIFYIFGFQSPYYLLLSINCYFIIFIIIVEFTLMLGISVVKGKATTVLPFILSVFSLTALIEIVANLSRYTAFDDSPAGKTGYVALFESFPTSTALAVMSLSLLLMAIIAVLVSFAVYVTAFVYTCIYKKPVKIKVIRKKIVRSKGAAALKKAQEEQEEPQFEEEPEP